MKNQIAKYVKKEVADLTQDDWITYIEMLLDFNQIEAAQPFIEEFEREFKEPY
jgi:hypothetical protein